MNTTSSKISLHTICRQQKENFIASILGDEMVLMDLKTGDYLALNSTSLFIWNQLELPCCILDIAAQVQQAYNVSEKECTSQILHFIEQLVAKELISVE